MVNKILKNMSSPLGIDLRIGSKDKHAGGYVRYQGNKDIKECIHLIKDSSEELNLFLEDLFSNKID